MHKNEFGEEVTEEELADLAVRVRQLTDKQIDDLWHLCSYIHNEREEKYKAITQKHIKKIRESVNSAKEVVKNLFSETPLKELKKNLSLIEK